MPLWRPMVVYAKPELGSVFSVYRRLRLWVANFLLYIYPSFVLFPLRIRNGLACILYHSILLPPPILPLEETTLHTENNKRILFEGHYQPDNGSRQKEQWFVNIPGKSLCRVSKGSVSTGSRSLPESCPVYLGNSSIEVPSRRVYHPNSCSNARSWISVLTVYIQILLRIIQPRKNLKDTAVICPDCIVDVNIHHCRPCIGRPCVGGAGIDMPVRRPDMVRSRSQHFPAVDGGWSEGCLILSSADAGDSPLDGWCHVSDYYRV